MKNKLMKLIGFIFGRKIFYYPGIILQHISHRMMGIGNFENEYITGEEYAIKTIAKLLKTKKIIFFDVGAGEKSENTELIREYFPKSINYLFEPMPKTFSKLKNKYSRKNNVFAFNIAVSDENGTLEMYDYKGLQTSHATTQKEMFSESDEAFDKISVKKTTIKTFVKKLKIKKIDFIKIDVEGEEYKVLSGIGNDINNINFIQFEFNEMNIYSGVKFKDFYDLLSENFNLYRMYQDGFIKINEYNPIYQEIYEFQNYLAINKKINY